MPSGRAGRLALDPDVVREQLHEQGVVPRSVGESLVLAESADRAEPDLHIGADRLLVCRGRVDRHAVVTVDLDEVTDERADRVGSEALSVDGGIEKQVDRRVAEFGVLFLVGLDQADEPAVDDDRVGNVVRLLDEELCLHPREVERRPPAGHFRCRQDRGKPRRIVWVNAPERDSHPSDLHRATVRSRSMPRR